MCARWIVTVSVVALAVAACAPEESASDAEGAWVGAITTEGNVTTVVNESGSVWGGAARLVEEASIGVEAGPEEYMFGFVSAVQATNDRIYLIDSQAPVVRAYDLDGLFIGNIGREGQGPGEYTSPDLLTADSSGRVFVFDVRLARINAYASSGKLLDTWPLQNSRCCAWQMFPLGRNSVWAPVQEWVDRDRSQRRFGARTVGPEGPYGEVVWVPEIDHEAVTYDGGGGYQIDVPFAPRIGWSPAPGRRLLAGSGEGYSFEVIGPGGARVIVQKAWDPVPIADEQREWRRRAEVAMNRDLNQREIDLELSDIPTHQPAYYGFIPTASGDVWIGRTGASVRMPDCAGDPIEVGYRAAMQNGCWRNAIIVDAFDVEGRYLGEVRFPPDVIPLASAKTLSVSGRRVVAVVHDDVATYMVKRYRLVLPGEEQ